MSCSITDVLGRRDLLRRASLAAVGAGFGGALAARPAGNRSGILLWLGGGFPQQDTFDMKPDAPREYRGEFRPIATRVPGTRICEHLPLTARHADKFTILRSLCSGETNHERAAHLLRGWLPPGIRVAAGAGASRELAAESPSLRRRYGLSPMGEGALLARRLVERGGARFVTVDSGSLAFDTHAGHFNRLKDELLPQFDRAFAALLEDLHERGMLGTTLVIAMGEFGRTPRINASGGRDHYARAWSVCLAGGGIPGGRVLGATDRYGLEVADLPVAPRDLLFTIRAILGADSGRPADGRMIPGLLS